jgi:hypothetical protein
MAQTKAYCTETRASIDCLQVWHLGFSDVHLRFVHVHLRLIDVT